MQNLPQDDFTHIDALALRLSRTFGAHPLRGHGLGRERLKTVIALLERCSLPAADELVDALMMRGQLVFEEEAEGPGFWRFGPAPARC